MNPLRCADCVSNRGDRHGCPVAESAGQHPHMRLNNRAKIGSRSLGSRTGVGVGESEEAGNESEGVAGRTVATGKRGCQGRRGAIYLWAQLPNNADTNDTADDVAIVRWLVKKHGVSVIPGSASGGPGFIRISYGGLTEEKCRVAASRLNKGLQELVDHGMN